ncbi:type II toxin-antitoxin system HicA family toxin [Ornithobacterium rhinotracheale]|uniref:type II toxin-antitoxin system HicA family toxin n=1 Tax=Ornithobacterium rhinotracheale TaxID=28251 RepID=UPI00129C9FFA|nr:type II toxin-antitoxin system HicA family toxin [Ornithobacterium rhinotracheale]MRI64557.1 type II toxin-antitoxin system HicA family toxin [Ornithobacterium rhinotracheale]MRJ07277.1 type II toxin-antitoxin system HicA family toxin [Ornithobacterium rhinotracheale]UOH77879.1 type II toxin-antitoxin system HicA family toxin [Ornithobacterium rhinotracheale]
MKYKEFFKFIKKNGWRLQRQGKGSHEIWEKNGEQISIPNHGSKEIPTGLEKSLKKQMGLK